ncbi:ABC transporter ATP-binding protein [Thermoflexus sp.]|uniref:ABC transporter ATP-binding protein n=1 Tax=Thermoflexus sp. TaxID=1969742 RepID=UPI0025D8D0E1|nr:energy-coupling factor transporter ATPase [Thermoflexus sp.]MDW8179508.1 energy-coupling factor transporter ATPase [Anaerolineae bacterium]MCS6964289.1 energy-coupling factor transporter ATPase [Thermoflexus sp.]MCS7350059.1 energy-coupling factor transporter ATPase [Thermoflexus sp.]MCX7689423.1 energy-coupling factor transporter ATPase [Thermoflexus sp.]MDW8185806.1 energy-coupling factor transporter ATPase [Anaerolineae bacterium]
MNEMKNTDAIVKLHEVTFTYEGGVVALRDLNLTVRRGEFVVVLGANGAGKSTLCYLLSGIIPHIYGGRRTGEVQVAGRDPWDDPIYITAQRCGVLLQDPEIQLFMPTVRAEVAFGPANLQVPREEIERRVAEALALVRLEGLEDRNPRDLSGGQKQRAALAAVLAMHPQVLVLDEPTSQLDPLGRWEVVQALHRLKASRDLTIIMTTHETDEVMDLADQVWVLEEGRCVLAGTPEEVFAQPERLEAVGVKPPTLAHVWIHIARQSGAPILGDGQRLRDLDVAQVAQQAATLLRQGRIRPRPLPDSVQPPSPARPAVIEVQDLVYRYPGYPPVTALKGVSLTVREGEFVGIIGQNGSGKSTLVKCIVGLLRPTAGQVRVLGEEVRRLSVGQLARRVGLVLQNPDYQLFTISSREEILFGLRNLGIPREEAEIRVQEALRWVGLETEAEIFPFRLSFGDRRKLAVAATLALDPQILILDEPTTAQDHRGRYQLAELARRFREEKGRTVIMITHDMELVARYAERVIVMWDGQILLDGTPEEVFGQTELLHRSFLRPPIAHEIARQLAAFGIPQRVLTTQDLLTVLGGWP